MALKGLKAFDAAAYCASITAAKRLHKDPKRKHRPSTDSTSLDMGIRHDAPDSPTALNACDPGLATTQVAHVHAEAFDAALPSSSHTDDNSASSATDSLSNIQVVAEHQATSVHPAQAISRSWWQRVLGCAPLRRHTP